MAINISNISDSLIFTSAIPDVYIYCEGSTIEVNILDENSKEIFTSKYDIQEGKVIVRNISDIIEPYMVNRRFIQEFCISAIQGEVEARKPFTAIYCDTNIDIAAEDWTDNNFMTTLSSKLTAPGFVESLTVIAAKADEKAICKGIYKSNNELMPFQIVLNLQQGDIWPSSIIHTDCDNILEKLQATIPSAESIAGYTVICGPRIFTYYVCPQSQIPPLGFAFTNMFGIKETYYFDGVTITKSKVNRDSAVLNKSLSFYNQSEECTYEVTTSILMPDEAEWIQQLFSSKNVWLINEGSVFNNSRVIITESTYEISDDVAATHKVKFTWQFPKNIRHRIFRAQKDREIFSREFDFQYE